jgi:Ca2+-binding RTX toxin-like protein
MGGDDRIFGGDGDDDIDDGEGNNELDGGRGNDTITANSGRSTIWGDDGNDSIEVVSTSNKTILFGGNGHDRIVVEGLFQSIEGGTGDDLIDWTSTTFDRNNRNDVDGNDGNDTLVMHGKGNVEISGGLGADKIYLNNEATDVSINYFTYKDSMVDSGFDRIYSFDTNKQMKIDLTAFNIELHFAYNATDDSSGTLRYYNRNNEADYFTIADGANTLRVNFTNSSILTRDSFEF